MNTAPVKEGDVLAGKYRVERVLGEGGMGVVVAARHLQLGERVALKFLRTEVLDNREVVARFGREARAAARIRSEHVARVTDVGALEDGAPYLVMEYLEGTDLGGALEKRGPLAVEDAAEYLLQACEAIGEAHSLGIVHRDLKPANLFLSRRHDGSACIKVLDFGISKVGGGEMGLTSTQAMMGSPLYMSPEQYFSARDVDGRTDVWSLGVILYELLGGAPPFTADSIGQLAVQITQGAPPPLGDRRPNLPQGLEALVMKCLERDRSKRYQNVGELAVGLARFAPQSARISAERVSRMMQSAGMAGTALAPPPATVELGAPSFERTAPLAAAPAISAVTDGAWAEKTRPPAPRSRTGLAVAGAVVAGAVVAGALYLRPSPAPPGVAASAATEPVPAAAVPPPPSARPEAPPAVAAPPAATPTTPVVASALPRPPSPAPKAAGEQANTRPAAKPAPKQPVVSAVATPPAAPAVARTASTPAPTATAKIDFGGRN